MGTVLLFFGATLLTYALHRHVRKQNRIKGLKEKQWFREVNRPYIDRLNNPKQKELKAPDFEYEAR
jgi:hypothetical protein